MNWAMYENPATRREPAPSCERGVEVSRGEPAISPAARQAPGGWLNPRRCAWRCAAPWPAPRRAARRRKVVVTSGGTREAIDAVRFVGNRSSGKMGHALAIEAHLRGADVVHITTQPGPESPTRSCRSKAPPRWLRP